MKLQLKNVIKKKASPVFRKYGVKRAFLFGSVARGEEKKRSDVDFVVQFFVTPSLVTLVAFERELGEKIGRRADVITSSQITPRLKVYIKDDLISLYEAR